MEDAAPKGTADRVVHERPLHFGLETTGIAVPTHSWRAGPVLLQNGRYW